MRKYLEKSVLMAILALVMALLSTPAFALAEGDGGTVSSPTGSDNGSGVVVVAQQKIVITAPVKPGLLAPSSGYGDGYSTITQHTNTCNNHEGQGEAKTTVYDNNNYDPQAIGTFKYNGVVQQTGDTGRQQGTYWVNVNAVWDSNFYCKPAAGTWNEDSTHVIYQVVNFVPFEVARGYTSAQIGF